MNEDGMVWAALADLESAADRLIAADALEGLGLDEPARWLRAPGLPVLAAPGRGRLLRPVLGRYDYKRGAYELELWACPLGEEKASRPEARLGHAGRRKSGSALQRFRRRVTTFLINNYRGAGWEGERPGKRTRQNQCAAPQRNNFWAFVCRPEEEKALAGLLGWPENFAALLTDRIP